MEDVLLLFITFFKIGLFTIGGGFAMIPLIQQEVGRFNLFTQQEIVDFIAVSESTPGPFAINISTYIGMKTAGPLGALGATFGVVLPSFLIILVVAKLFMNFSQNKFVRCALDGVRPSIVGLISGVVATLFLSNILNLTLSHINIADISVNLKGIIIFTIVLAYNIWKKPHPIKIILLSGLLGMLLFFL